MVLLSVVITTFNTVIFMLFFVIQMWLRTSERPEQRFPRFANCTLQNHVSKITSVIVFDNKAITTL